MRNYEGLFIIDADLQTDASKGVITQIQEMVSKNGGRVESMQDWGKKRMAYKINKKQDGQYVLLNFPRLRVGVANASMPKDLAAFVLEPFNGAERKALNKILEGAASVCRAWAQKDLTAAQTLLSRNQQKE